MIRRERLLIYSLGRVTTAYGVAKAFKQKDAQLSQGEVGAWSTCKKGLILEKRIIEIKPKKTTSSKQVRGWNRKPFKANISKYLEDILDMSESFKKENQSLFEKYSPKIVDYIIKKNLIKKDYDLSFPFIFFLLSRYLVTVKGHIQESLQKTIIGKVNSFVINLSEDEKKEFLLQSQKEDQTVNIMLQLMPSSLFKEVFIELGSKLLNASIFKKKQFDYFIGLFDHIETDEDFKKIQKVLEEIKNDKYKKRCVEDYETKQELMSQIMAENQEKI